nr:reverse transcriptase domain-containing protein [Tanacetum cinerariifolium]
MNFPQKFDETFSEAWDRFKDLIRKCPRHGFLELHQIDTIYNTLTQSDQDSLNAATGGNLLNHTPRDALTTIENKSKVRTSQNKPVVSKVSTTTSSSSPSPDITALTEIVKELLFNVKATQQATAKAIEESCVICGGPHPYYECLATGGNTFDACAAVRTYNQGGNGYRPQGDPNYRAINQMGPFDFPPPNKLSLPDLTPIHMTLKLATRSYAYLAGIAEDVFVQVGKFTFPADFVVFNYDVDPRVSPVLGGAFLRMAHALDDEFVDELALLDPFPPGKEDNNFDFESDVREIEYLLNQDPSTESNIKTIDPILEKFTHEPALDYLPPSGDDDDDDDDLFDLKCDYDEWKKLLYGDCYKEIDSEKDKNKDSKMKSLVVEAHIF